MFTGLVRGRGRVQSFEHGRLHVQSPLAADVAIGDSVAVDGCCLTVVEARPDAFAFDVVPETIARTSLARLSPGGAVNLEPALRAGEPLGGHIVQGHVDGVGRIRSVRPEGDGRRIWIDVPAEVLRYCIEKGSIAVAGVSLTIAALDEAGVAIALVPHTLAETTLGEARPGDEVNLEGDVLAKYVERLVANR